MINRRFTVLTLAAVAFSLLLIPAPNVQAQSIWDIIRESTRDRRDDDYERDRRRRRDDDDGYYGRHRDDDYYGRHRPGRISDGERRHLRDLGRRIEDRSEDFQRNLDRFLDRSRHNGSQREDHVNDDVKQFRRAADRFRDKAGDSNDLNRSAGEARQLLETASHVERYLRRLRLDSRTASDWRRIRSDLGAVSRIYGFRYRDFDYDDGYYRRDRHDDDYYGDDDYYRRDRRDRSRNRDARWRFPF